MFNSFPREVASPTRILVYSKDEFLNKVNSLIRRTGVFTSVYHFTAVDKEKNKPDYNSALVDKIFLDIDESNEWDNLRKFHDRLKERNIQHTVMFSGRGFHIYIFCKVVNGNAEGWVKSQAIKQWVQDNVKDLKYDNVVVGDLARITRIPNTFNFKGRRFCIPLTEEMIRKTYEEISEIARRQNFNYQFYGDTKIELKVENVTISSVEKDYEKMLSEETTEETDIVLEVEFPPFLKKILAQKKETWGKESGWKDRALVIIWLKEQGFSLRQTIQFLKLHFTVSEYRHSVLEEKQPFYIFKRDLTHNPFHFPNIKKLLDDGYKLSKEDLEFFKSNRLYLSEEEFKNLIKNSHSFNGTGSISTP